MAHGGEEHRAAVGAEGLGSCQAPRSPPPAHQPSARARSRNRAAAAQLASAAELWSAAGRAEGTGAEIWRAAREAEGFDRDLAALAREGRLGLLPWLAGPARGVVEAWAAGRPAELLAQLEEEWLAEKETAG